MKKVKVLVVDDSAFVREILSRSLSLDSSIEVVGTASNSYKARDQIIKLKPDVLTLDVEMPGMNGVDFLKKLMEQHPIPVIMVSALTERGSQVTLDALQAGAVDFVLKPSKDIERGLKGMIEDIQRKVKMAARVSIKMKPKKKALTKSKLQNKQVYSESACSVIAIGASTGGTTALAKVLEKMSVNSPCILVVQHMPAGFTAAFAKRLDSVLDFEVKEAQHGDKVRPGRVLIAPGNYHMELFRSGNDAWVTINSKPKIKSLRPSIDPLFRSVAKFEKNNAIGVMLTGMGDDGADAMLEMRKAGARTLAQDQASSVVYGMPKQAYENGAAERLVSLEKIASKIDEYLKVI